MNNGHICYTVVLGNVLITTPHQPQAHRCACRNWVMLCARCGQLLNSKTHASLRPRHPYNTFIGDTRFGKEHGWLWMTNLAKEAPALRRCEPSDAVKTILVVSGMLGGF